MIAPTIIYQAKDCGGDIWHPIAPETIVHRLGRSHRQPQDILWFLQDHPGIVVDTGEQSYRCVELDNKGRDVSESESSGDPI